MPLSDAACRSAKSAEKPYKLGDAGGLYLLVETSGSRLWRQAYRFDGKQRLIALGAYPAVSLADARIARDANKALLAKGVDPSAQRKLDRGAARIARTNTFRIVADELIAKFEAEGDDPATIEKKKWLIGLLSGDIGDRPIAEIAAPELLDALRKVERRGRYESARRARSLAGRVFRYAIATGRAERDPSGDLAGALISPKVQHRASITEPKRVGALLRAVDDIDGQITTRAALQLIALTFVRPGELRHAEWKEFDLRGAVWSIPKEKMKMPRPHLIPLSRQAIALIADLREVTGSSPFLFPQIRSWHRPISDGTLNAALRRLGYDKTQMTAHGFRSTASTRLNESRLWHHDAIERQLAHMEADEVRAAYNAAEYWDERVRMMQWWADYLDDLRKSGAVVPIAKARRSRSAAS
ncbi:tyrosine-type recombinase/integrase [Bradyrhizobium sp. 197]|uniref:tyrosine-type recombinase/integrase n=1 Tax=unclassified Bradyrhizobium TaxID=2631580 RepID=UPI001FF79569|nr:MULTISPECIES: integrase arm-type DNA-binding domain-containing protein [unclassified Bradyrhizobium]MCK1474907.1 tyrosine-type recombinase/integrase [Bradyrhizobium sp. 197]UPJ57656.1 tyrosine-type recombinase/integrase [Bradyrhizobium sp. 192]